MQTPPPLDTGRHALLLDFDGTLVDFSDDPAAVRIEPAALASLLALGTRLSGALAIVSGRRIADLDRFLAPLRFAAAGVHGLEMRTAHDLPITETVDPRSLERVRRSLSASVEATPGLRLEDKGSALVLHYRGREDLGGAARSAMERAVADVPGLKIVPGHSIVEVHPAGMDKGRALEALMREAPFAARLPVYLGDDRTDEDAMAAAQRAGGIGIKIGPGESVAAARLADVAAVHAWLAAASGARPA